MLHPVREPPPLHPQHKDPPRELHLHPYEARRFREGDKVVQADHLLQVPDEKHPRVAWLCPGRATILHTRPMIQIAETVGFTIDTCSFCRSNATWVKIPLGIPFKQPGK